MLDEGLGSKVQHRGGAAQTKPESTTVKEFNGQPRPAPRQSCLKQAGKHHREEVIGQHKSQKRSGCPKYEQKTSREGSYWAAKASTAEKLPKKAGKHHREGS